MNPQVSDYIVEYFLANKGILLENAGSRTLESNMLRKTYTQRLVEELAAKFGVISDVVRIKQHFDNRKLKIGKRGQDYMRNQMRRSVDGAPTDDPDRLPFDGEVDKRLWAFISSDDSRREGSPPPLPSLRIEAPPQNNNHHFREPPPRMTPVGSDPVAIAMDLLARHNKERQQQPRPQRPMVQERPQQQQRPPVVVKEEPDDPPTTLEQALQQQRPIRSYSPWGENGTDNATRAAKQILSPEVSDYILTFFMDNHQILLGNASSRSLGSNQERKTLVARLVEEIQQHFGVETDAVKVRCHFDNRRSRIVKKGSDLRALSGGLVLTQNMAQNMFDSPVEARVWNYFEPTMATGGDSDDSNSREGARMVFQPDRVKEESPSNDDDWLAAGARIPQLFDKGKVPNPVRRITPAPMAISGIPTLPLPLIQPERKRRRLSGSQDPSPDGFTPRHGWSDEALREKQMDLIQKQLNFYEHNTRLVQKMTCAVDLLLTRLGVPPAEPPREEATPPEEDRTPNVEMQQSPEEQPTPDAQTTPENQTPSMENGTDSRNGETPTEPGRNS